ncbi:MAG: hypothetical protein M1823_006628, partial [Watsoniomyces obsoletus]
MRASSFKPSARRAWDDRVDAAILHAAERVPRSPFIVGREEPRPAHPTVIDWTGLPLRVTGCLPRADALALLDWTGASGCEARRRIQDEYLEWRVLRDSDDVVRRVESTCELPDAWRVLAAHAPAGFVPAAARLAPRTPALASTRLQPA